MSSALVRSSFAPVLYLDLIGPDPADVAKWTRSEFGDTTRPPLRLFTPGDS
jgi:hypothetical protein